MTEQTKAEGPDEGEGTEAVNGGPEFQRTPGKAEGEDPDGPESKPQGTLRDQASITPSSATSAFRRVAQRLLELSLAPAVLQDFLDPRLRGAIGLAAKDPAVGPLHHARRLLVRPAALSLVAATVVASVAIPVRRLAIAAIAIPSPVVSTVA